MSRQTVLSVSSDVPWIAGEHEVRCVSFDRMPEIERISSVFALCFQDQRLLMINHQNRGWDIPGGHIEPGESPEEALEREVDEEASARIRDYSPIAVIEVTLQGEKPEDYHYPFPTSYMICYLAEIEELKAFEGKFESTERALLDPLEARESAWVVANRELYQYALGVQQARRAGSQ